MSGALVRLFMTMVLLVWTAKTVVAEGEVSSGPAVEFSVDSNRGYFIGDLVKVSYRSVLPKNLRVGAVSLPEGDKPVNQWVEVRERKIRETVSGERRIYDLAMTYQVFSASEKASSLQIPEIPFSFGPGETTALYNSAFPAVPIVISPLTSEGDSFKPLIMWSWKSPSPEMVRKIGLSLFLISAMMLSFLIWMRLQRHSPFDAALKRLSGETEPGTALAIFRRALNEKAERAVFYTNTEDFFQVVPKSRALKDEVLRLILLSDELSFNPESGAISDDGLPGRVQEILKKLKRSET